MCTRKSWEPEKSYPRSRRSREGWRAEGRPEAASWVGRMTDRGVVPRMATKATSRPEGGPRLVRNPDEKLGTEHRVGPIFQIISSG
jgi:hypothetical protein